MVSSTTRRHVRGSLWNRATTLRRGVDILSSVSEIIPNPIAIARLVAAISPAFNAVKKYADAAVVKVTAEIVSKDVDRGQFLDKIDSEDLAIMVASLRKSLGLKNGRSGGDDCGN